jgi:hypothetical protein
MPRRIALLMFVLLSASAIVTLSSVAHAQSIGSTDTLSVEINPDTPSPYQTITIVPSSTLIDIAASTITVTVNGSKTYSGSGSAPISAQIGGPGTSTSIVVTATSGGRSYSKKIVITPEQVALITEPVSTTHAFYAGKGLVSPAGRVRFIAMPAFVSTSGKAIDPTKLEYTWRMNEKILESDSGIGKNILDAQAPDRYRDVTVSVTVQTVDGSLVAQAKTPVSPVDPITRIYEDDPLLGALFNNALTDQVALSGDEETFLGVPYYFSERPALTWQVNGTNSGTDGDITVRATGNGQGTAALSFAAAQTDTAQTANSTMSVLFGATKSLGLFGL